MIKEFDIKEITRFSEIQEIEDLSKNDSNDFIFKNKIGQIQQNIVSLKVEHKSIDLLLNELAFVRIQTDQKYRLNWIGFFISVVFFSFLFLVNNMAFPLVIANFFLFFIALTFSLYYKKYRYVIIVVLRVAQLVVVRVEKNDLPEAQLFVKELSKQIIKKN